MTSDLFIESLPTREEFQALMLPLGLDVITYRDEFKLYLMVAQKRNIDEDYYPQGKTTMNQLDLLCGESCREQILMFQSRLMTKPYSPCSSKVDVPSRLATML
jgi:hypothetical protein